MEIWGLYNEKRELTGALRETQEEVGLTLSPEGGKQVHSVVGRIVNGVKYADILDVWLFE